MEKRKSLFVKCLIASLAFHCAAVFVIYKQPILLTSPMKFFFRGKGSNPTPYTAEKLSDEEKSTYLDEALSKFCINPPFNSEPTDIDSRFIEQITLLPKAEEAGELHCITDGIGPSEQKFDYESKKIAVKLESQTTTENYHEDELAAYNNAHPLEEETGLTNFVSEIKIQSAYPEEIDKSLSALPSTSYKPHKEKAGSVNLPFLKETTLCLQVSDSPAKAKKTIAPAYAATPKSLVLPRMTLPTLNVVAKPPIEGRKLPSIDHYAIPSAPLGRSWNDYFTFDLHVFPDKAHKRYVFFLSFLPKADLSEEKLTQNFYFLIDRSNVDRNRFAIYKKGVLKALASLQEGDKFNIFLFDQKIVKFRESNIPYTKSSLSDVESFLNKQEVRRFVSSTDLCLSLEHLLPRKVSNRENHTAILLSDGNTFFNPAKQQQAISEFLAKNQNKIALYTASMGTGNNIGLLELLSSLNKGKFVYSDTFAAFPRKLGKLVLDLREPLANNIKITHLPTSKEAKIHFYPTATKRPNLFAASPYVIMGTTDRLQDFTLLISGQHGKEMINIEKAISFLKQKKATADHQNLWQGLLAQKCFELFVEHGDLAYMEKAQKYLKDVR